MATIADLNAWLGGKRAHLEILGGLVEIECVVSIPIHTHPFEISKNGRR
jgi:hypothetical protein